MLDALKPLIDSGVLNADSQRAITEAWDARLAEARTQLSEQLRAEFAQRHQHDRETLVEALDKMVTQALAAEITEFQRDRQGLREQRVRETRRLKTLGESFERFLTQQLSQEIAEFRGERQKQRRALRVLEGFVTKNLRRELVEFQTDKRRLAETRVRLVAEAQDKLNDLKQKFVKRSSQAVETLVERHLQSELKQLRTDITQAKKNNFGRRIFEAFAAEYGHSQLNENQKIRELNRQLTESQKLAARSQRLLREHQTQVQNLRAGRERDALLTELLTPLSRENQRVMRDLLESVQTPGLRKAFDKYLPALVKNSARPDASTARRELVENRSVTGDRNTPVADPDNIIEIKRLAGL